MKRSKSDFLDALVFGSLMVAAAIAVTPAFTAGVARAATKVETVETDRGYEDAECQIEGLTCEQGQEFLAKGGN